MIRIIAQLFAVTVLLTAFRHVAPDPQPLTALGLLREQVDPSEQHGRDAYQERIGASFEDNGANAAEGVDAAKICNSAKAKRSAEAAGKAKD